MSLLPRSWIEIEVNDAGRVTLVLKTIRWLGLVFARRVLTCAIQPRWTPVAKVDIEGDPRTKHLEFDTVFEAAQAAVEAGHE